jgi:hypothetical protein
LSRFDRHACFVTGAYILIVTFADYFQSFRFVLEKKIDDTLNGLYSLPR